MSGTEKPEIVQIDADGNVTTTDQDRAIVAMLKALGGTVTGCTFHNCTIELIPHTPLLPLDEGSEAADGNG